MTMFLSDDHEVRYRERSDDALVIMKTFRFEAAHQLPYHDGKCRRLHGHSYQLTIAYQGAVQEIDEANPSSGMVLDFSDLKATLAEVIDALDHRDLNGIVEYPTAERLVVWIAAFLVARLGRGVRSVLLFETDDSSAMWVNPLMVMA